MVRVRFLSDPKLSKKDHRLMTANKYSRGAFADFPFVLHIESIHSQNS